MYALGMPMIPAETTCKVCATTPDDSERFDCPTCGRLVNICPTCGRWLRLFESEDPRDCEVCESEHAQRTAEEDDRQRLLTERFVSGFVRTSEDINQMRERSGPLYDESRRLGKIVADAYRAAGRPRQVVKLWRGGYAHPVRTGPFHHDLEPATEAEWSAWQAWVEERRRIRREIGVQR